MQELSSLRLLTHIAAGTLCLLMFRVLVAILYEYRWYFPPDFTSAFLTGREAYFPGIYRWAFYTHIICGPCAIVLGSYLAWSGSSTQLRTARMIATSRWRSNLHRRLGWLQIVVIVAGLVPSGMVMAPYAFAGAIASLGFACLSILTAITAIFAANGARRLRDRSTNWRDQSVHQAWSTRCLILLFSALWLRIGGGLALVWELDPATTYRFNAWLSWVVPLVVYELYNARRVRW